MPSRAPRRCTQCPAKATNAGRCAEHQVKPWARPSANSQALNGRQRENLRAQALARDPRCGVCESTDTTRLELDHIIEISDGGARLDPANTWLLCHDCHTIKTAQARRARAARRRSSRG